MIANKANYKNYELFYHINREELDEKYEFLGLQLIIVITE